jgi:hypothetical protein
MNAIQIFINPSAVMYWIYMNIVDITSMKNTRVTISKRNAKSIKRGEKLTKPMKQSGFLF